MAKKIYCIKIGKKTGKFYSWDECKSNVSGFKGAIYKSFTTEEEADIYLSGVQNLQAETVNTTNTSEQEFNLLETAIAYVDGSYNIATEEFSCGVLILYKEEQVEISKKYYDKELSSMRNVSGEVMGATEAIKYCIENKIPNLKIYHDYQGVASWANNEWKTNKEGTRAYKEFCDKSREKLNFSFVKVKAHSGDKYNDIADLLAKKALGLA